MKLQIKTTFDFCKLAKKMPEIIKELVDESKMVFAEMSVKNINDGLRPLAKASIEARRKGHYWGKEKVNPTSKTRPLDYTRNLIKSIKLHEQGVIMNEYGLHQNNGFFIPMKRAGVTFNQKVKGRPFLAMKLDAKNVKGTKFGKAQKQFLSLMDKRIAKALKK